MFSKISKYAGAMLLALSACTTAPEPSLTTVQLGISGATDMNGGAPAKVKIYYLNSAATFRSSDFFAVFGEPEATLGTDLIAVDEFQLAPGKTVTDTRNFDTPPVAIGVVAAFRDVGGAGFLAVKPLSPDAVNAVRVTLTGNTAAIQ